jgi:hypothetical protein
VTHLEKIPSFYGNVSYRVTKGTLTKAFDLERLPQTLTEQTLWADTPSFARSPGTWAETEVDHERH